MIEVGVKCFSVSSDYSRDQNNKCGILSNANEYAPNPLAAFAQAESGRTSLGLTPMTSNRNAYNQPSQH